MYTSLLLLAVSQACGSLTPSPDWNSSYRLALRRAEESQKPLAVVIGAGTSGWDGLSTAGELDPPVRKILANRYICLYVDASQPDGRELADSFKARTLPSLVLSDRSGTYVAFRQSGTVPNNHLATILRDHSEAPPYPTAVETPRYFAPAMIAPRAGARSCPT